MPLGWLSFYRPIDVAERAERRVANRPARGKRTKVKAARKQRSRSAKR